MRRLAVLLLSTVALVAQADGGAICLFGVIATGFLLPRFWAYAGLTR